MTGKQHTEAFVVQFRGGTDVAGRYDGRLEHVASGRVTHFQSLEELAALLKRWLTDLGAALWGIRNAGCPRRKAGQARKALDQFLLIVTESQHAQKPRISHNRGNPLNKEGRHKPACQYSFFIAPVRLTDEFVKRFTASSNNHACHGVGDPPISLIFDR